MNNCWKTRLDSSFRVGHTRCSLSPPRPRWSGWTGGWWPAWCRWSRCPRTACWSSGPSVLVISDISWKDQLMLNKYWLWYHYNKSDLTKATPRTEMTMRARMQMTAAITAPAPPPASSLLEATRGCDRGVSSSHVRSVFCLKCVEYSWWGFNQPLLNQPVATQTLALSSLALVRILKHCESEARISRSWPMKWQIIFTGGDIYMIPTRICLRAVSAACKV